MPRRSSLLRQAFTLRTHGLGRRVFSGASYQFLGIVLRTVITIGSTAVLARLLAPADFGYIAMATVVTEFAALFSNFGLNNLLIQRHRINRLQVDTVFWASALLGVALGMMVFLASFFARLLFADPRVGELLQVLCLTFALSGLGTIPNVVLARLMRFQTDFWIQITVVLLRTAGAIAFAYAGFGVWSLVAGALIGTLLQCVLGFVAVPYLPRSRFHAQLLTSTWRTSGSYFGGGLPFYANHNLDLDLIGRHLGATSLGYYQNARSLTDEIRSRIAIPLQHVLFPAFSAVQVERERMQSIVLKSGRILAAVVIPMGLGVSAVSEELVRVLYGPQWLTMIPLMSVFGFVAAMKAGTAISGPLFNACNRVGLGLKYGLIATVLVCRRMGCRASWHRVRCSCLAAVGSLWALAVSRCTRPHRPDLGSRMEDSRPVNSSVSRDVGRHHCRPNDHRRIDRLSGCSARTICRWRCAGVCSQLASLVATVCERPSRRSFPLGGEVN